MAHTTRTKEKEIKVDTLAKKGVIVKGISGYYYVYADGEIHECRARGKFRLDGSTPLPGDFVEFEEGESLKDGYVLTILPRKNMLRRPPVANVDQLVLVVSASRPKPDLLLIDKLLVQADRAQVGALLVLNKVDVAEDKIVEQVEMNYADIPLTFCRTSAHARSGLIELEKHLGGKLSCFAGQSAVGKSSLLNALSHGFDFETGSVSEKTGRGRHTTRAVELRELDSDSNSFVMDTPGFSLLSLEDLPPEELSQHYMEMQALKGQCRFDNCLHVKEPGCAVKQAVDEGEISIGRYQRYLKILEELQSEWDNKYR